LGIIGYFYRNRLLQRYQRQETRRLQELDSFKNRFFTNISHEFRTPLTVILGTTEQLAAAVQPPELKQKTGLIKRSSENLLRLINQLLDLAKLESSTLTLHYVQGDVLAYLRYIAESLHSLANAQNVMLRVKSPEKEIVMDYDPERLLQIVHNLLSNAIKFTPSGGRVVLQAVLQDSWLLLQVTDNGAGIPSADLPHIFDRFYQAKNLEKAKTGGTGIGLALTRELVHLLGGDISVKSEPGKGTTFEVKLPVHRQAAQRAPAVPEGRTEVSVNTVLTAEPFPDLPTLLLVEDNPDVVEFLTACLKQQYNLEFAFNGRAGIEKALQHIPDLVVSDVMMPEKDGFELCQTLKDDERTSHIPIILLTAKAGVEHRIAGLKRGADAYLSKPFHQEELLATLANLLELRRKLQARYAQTLYEPAPAPAGRAAPDPEDAFLQKIRAVVEANLGDDNFESANLEQALAMSRSQIFRKVKALTGHSPSIFIRSIRLHKGRQLLQTTGKTVSEIAFEVGFSSVKYFSDAFVKEFGIRPTEVRSQ
jgi:CheY-like chemotaxis protein/nitrogen-specific signal transduction histidine kinase